MDVAVDMSATTFGPPEAARIAAALLKAIAEAKSMADAENIGPDLHNVVRHARELHGIVAA